MLLFTLYHVCINPSSFSIYSELAVENRAMLCLYSQTHVYTHFWHSFVHCHSSRGTTNTSIRSSHSWAPVPNTSSIPSQHASFNQLTLIPLLYCSMSLYGPFSPHNTCLCSPQPLLGKVSLHDFSLHWGSLMCGCFHCFTGAKQLFMWAWVTGPLLFCILCNSACQLRKVDKRIFNVINQTVR